MSHNIYTNGNTAAMAYLGNRPWHELGQSMADDATLEEWTTAAGFNYEILRGQSMFTDAGGFTHKGLGEHLYRSDTLAPLSMVSKQYKVVQPSEIMDFFREVCALTGFKLETAGVLKGGAVYWALAKTSDVFRLQANDETHGYVLLASSADKSLATIAKLTSVRVVCWNTLSYSASKSGERAFRTIHTKQFDKSAALAELGLSDFSATFEQFGDQLADLARKPVSKLDASDFFSELLRPGTLEEREQSKKQSATAGGIHDFSGLLGKPMLARESNVITAQDRFIPSYADTKERAIRGHTEILDCYENAPGAAPGSAYGILQGVTRYVDHARGKNADKRMHSAFFGQGDKLKQTAFSKLLDM